MSPVTEAGLTAMRELRRNLRSTKGIAMFVLFFLGGLVPSLIEILFFRLVDKTTLADAPLELRQQFAEQMLTQAYGAETAKHLATCPPVLFAILFKVALFFIPLLVLLIGFDQIAGEIQHRSIRYLAGRARRSSLVAGKALGVWGVIAVMTLVLHVTVWALTIARGDYPASLVLSWGARVWLFTVASAGAYVGLITLVSSFFRSPIVALFCGLGVLMILGITNAVLGLSEVTQAATWAFPATYESKLLISPNPLYVIGGMAALIAWGSGMVAAAAAVVSRKDI